MLGALRGGDKGCPQQQKEREGKSNTHHERIHMNNKDDDGH